MEQRTSDPCRLVFFKPASSAANFTAPGGRDQIAGGLVNFHQAKFPGGTSGGHLFVHHAELILLTGTIEGGNRAD